jgi:hypothetical protein
MPLTRKSRVSESQVHAADLDCGCVVFGNSQGRLVAGRTSPAALHADLHRNAGHGFGLIIAIWLQPRSTPVPSLIKYRNKHGIGVGCKARWDHELVLSSTSTSQLGGMVQSEHDYSLIESNPLFAFLCLCFPTRVAVALVLRCSLTYY